MEITDPSDGQRRVLKRGRRWSGVLSPIRRRSERAPSAVDGRGGGEGAHLILGNKGGSGGGGTRWVVEWGSGVRDERV